MSKKVIDIYSPTDRSRSCTGGRDKKECKKGRSNLLLIFFCIALPLGGYFYYTSYKTNITIYPEVQRVEESREVLVHITGALEENSIRGVILSERLEDTREFEVENVKMIEEKAEGQIEACQNYSPFSMNFLKGTRFISDGGEYFVAKEAFVLPGQATNRGCKVVDVIAMEAGEDHNIPNNSSFTLPGLLGHPSYARVSGEKFKLTKKGTRREVPDIDEETRYNAEKQMMKDLLEKGFLKIKEEEKGQYFLESENQFKVDVIERKFEEIEGEDDKFLYKLDVMVRAIAISNENVDEFIKGLLSGDMVWRKETEEIDIEFLYFDFENEKAEAVLNITVDAHDKVDKEGLKRLVAGFSFVDAQEKIKGQVKTEKIVIKSFPFGFSRILEDYSRIDIKLQFDKK